MARVCACGALILCVLPRACLLQVFRFAHGENDFLKKRILVHALSSSASPAGWRQTLSVQNGSWTSLPSDAGPRKHALVPLPHVLLPVPPLSFRLRASPCLSPLYTHARTIAFPPPLSRPCRWLCPFLCTKEGRRGAPLLPSFPPSSLHARTHAHTRAHAHTHTRTHTHTQMGVEGVGNSDD